MDKGHIVESGSHEELLEKTVVKDAEGKTTQGLYRDLWETQMGTKDKESDKKKIESLMIQEEDLKWQLSAARGEKRRASLKGAIQAVKLATPLFSLLGLLSCSNLETMALLPWPITGFAGFLLVANALPEGRHAGGDGISQRLQQLCPDPATEASAIPTLTRPTDAAVASVGWAVART